MFRLIIATFIFCFYPFNLASAQSSIDVRGNVGGSGIPGGSILLGFDSSACTSSIEGAIRYNSSSSCAEYCNGSEWVCPGGLIGAKTMFVTMTTYTANFGGVSGADSICASRASTAGLVGTYLAWLATDSSNTPDARFNKSNNPYKLVNGTVVANSYADLIDGTLSNPINRDEYGNVVAASNVWTNVNANGTQYVNSDVAECYNFTTNSGSFSARIGVTSATTGAWTSSGGNNCSALNRLYCVQQ